MPRGTKSKLDNDPALAKLVVNEYVAGHGMRDIQRRHRLGWDALRRHLVAAGVEIRPCGWSTPKTAKPFARNRSVMSDEDVERLRALIKFNPEQREGRSS